PSSIRAIDMRLIEDLFEMHSGYVLDFTNRTFAEFFQDELRINIDHPKYAADGTIKAKRLRFFLRSSSPDVRARTLPILWEFREARRRRERLEEAVPDAEREFQALLSRITGKPKRTKIDTDTSVSTSPAVSEADQRRLKSDLVALTSLGPQERGY